MYSVQTVVQNILTCNYCNLRISCRCKTTGNDSVQLGKSFICYFLFTLPGVRHEAAVQVRDDQALGLRLLLGGAGHHGARQLRVVGPATLRLPGHQVSLHGHGLHARSVEGPATLRLPGHQVSLHGHGLH